jgi:hypothetical protein
MDRVKINTSNEMINRLKSKGKKKGSSSNSFDNSKKGQIEMKKGNKANRLDEELLLQE